MARLQLSWVTGQHGDPRVVTTAQSQATSNCTARREYQSEETNFRFDASPTLSEREQPLQMRYCVSHVQQMCVIVVYAVWSGLVNRWPCDGYLVLAGRGSKLQFKCLWATRSTIDSLESSSKMSKARSDK